MVGHGLVRTGGVWKEPIKISAKTGGVWKDLTAGFVRTAGAWQQFYPSVIVDPTLALDLDFTTGTLDSKVTFTRSTRRPMSIRRGWSRARRSMRRASITTR